MTIKQNDKKKHAFENQIGQREKKTQYDQTLWETGLVIKKNMIV